MHEAPYFSEREMEFLMPRAADFRARGDLMGSQAFSRRGVLYFVQALKSLLVSRVRLSALL